jgi:hypothetical protein
VPLLNPKFAKCPPKNRANFGFAALERDDDSKKSRRVLAHVPAKWTPVRSPRCAPSQRADKNMRQTKI